MNNGGYDDLYRASPCAWGSEPGSLVKILTERGEEFHGARVLDAGCGEGKNAIFLARLGAIVDAFDVSNTALCNAKNAWPDHVSVNWQKCQVEQWDWTVNTYDFIIAYGLLHCLDSKRTIHKIVDSFKLSTKPGGINVICAFNNRFQDLRAHPGFEPTLLSHADYTFLYRDWVIEVETDSDLWESHPHNNIRHCHALTRIVARKPPR